MEPVLRDLRSTGVATPRVQSTDWTHDTDLASAVLHGRDDAGTGVYVSRSASVPEQAASMADQVQEWAIEELWDHSSTNWPPCPRHPTSHPMRATVQGATAVWVCPVDEALVTEIGNL